MKVFSMLMLEHWLGDSLVRCHHGTEEPCCTGGIRLLDDGEHPLMPSCLYVGTPDTVRRAVCGGRAGVQAVAILCAGGEPLEIDVPESLTLFETSLDLISLYNKVQEHIHVYQDWDSALRQVVYANGGLQKLLRVAAAEIDATILLVNPGYRHIASIVHPAVSEPTAVELQENGYLMFETIQGIHHETPLRQSAGGDLVEYVSRESGNYTIIRLIRYQDNLVARLCFVLNGPRPNFYFSELTRTVAEYVAEYMLGKQGMIYGANAALGALAADLIEGRLTDPDALEQRLKQIKLSVRRFYHVALVQFNGCGEVGGVKWNYAISLLERLFTHCNIATYRGNILMIIRKTDRSSRLSFDEARMMRILEQYDGYAAIGNATEFLMSLPPVYHQTRDTMRIGQTLDPDKRIFFYEDYSMYQIIEMAADSAQNRLGSQNLAHLCNNEIIALLMHDKKHGSDLAEVLRVYLRNERNATATAKELYIHRNTMLYKIHKIEEVIGASLDNPMLRERLLFSYRVMEYMQRYQKEDILLPMRAQNQEKRSEADDGAEE